jgi:hypothetical protein
MISVTNCSCCSTLSSYYAYHLEHVHGINISPALYRMNDSIKQLSRNDERSRHFMCASRLPRSNRCIDAICLENRSPPQICSQSASLNHLSISISKERKIRRPVGPPIRPAEENEFTCHKDFIHTVYSAERIVAQGPDGNVAEVVDVGVMCIE